MTSSLRHRHRARRARWRRRVDAADAARDRRYTPPGDAAEAVLYVRSPEAMRRLALSFTAIAADSTGSAPCSTTAAITACRRRRAPKYSFCTRCSIARRRSIRASTSRTASARSFWPKSIRAAPDGPISRSRCSQKGIAAQPERWEYLRRHRLRLLLAAARLQGGRRLVRSRRPDPRRAVVAADDGGGDAHARRRSRVVASAVAAAAIESADNDWLRNQARAAARAARRDGSDRRTAGHRRPRITR